MCMRISMCGISPHFIGPIGFGSEANVAKFLPDGVSLLFAQGPPSNKSHHPRLMESQPFVLDIPL